MDHLLCWFVSSKVMQHFHKNISNIRPSQVFGINISKFLHSFVQQHEIFICVVDQMQELC